MPFEKSPPDVVRSVRQRWLLSHWSQTRGREAVPVWTNLAADDLAKMAESLLFCDVAAEGDMRFLIRFCGARITEIYGPTEAKYLDDVLPATIRDEAIMAYKETVRTKQPVFMIADTHDSAGRPVNFERLLLPFSRNGKVVDRILASLEMVSIEGGFDRRNLLSPRSPLTYSLRTIIEPA